MAPMILLAISGCSGRSERSAGTLLDRSQQDPAISGDGRLLAVISERRGRPSVQLRDLQDGRILPLSQLNRHQPHSSPSLSWNGRYLALITQRGQRRLAVVADRLTGRLPTSASRREGPGEAEPRSGWAPAGPAGGGSGAMAGGTA